MRWRAEALAETTLTVATTPHLDSNAVTSNVTSHPRRKAVDTMVKTSHILCQYGEPMDFDWLNPPFDAKAFPTPREVEESFEDPMGIRLYPDSPRFAQESRAFCLGRTLSGRGVFSVYRSDGKMTRVVATRPMTAEEEYFYGRKVSEWTS